MKVDFCVVLVYSLFDIVNTTLINYDIVDSITKNGYPVEYHEIETEDGYILGNYRIPYGRGSTTKKVNQYPVLLLHGLMSTSEAFLLLGPDKSLGYKLADNGFDVWLCNARGTHHSRKHKTLNPDVDEKFWNFSWHEIGVYDVPAAIDYVLDITGREKVHLVGHSQGATVFFVMGSERPEYNQKIGAAIMLSPPVFLTRSPNPLLDLFIPFLPIVENLAKALKVHEIIPLVLSDVVQQIGEIICGRSSKFITSCRELLRIFAGRNEDQIDLPLVSLVSASHPGGCSVNQIFHYGQLITSGRFQKYDWGPIENLRIYGSKKPPEYNLKDVTAPVAIFYAEFDVFAQTVGILHLAKILPNLVELYKVPYENWTHIDFIWGRDVNIYLNKMVIDVMRKYNNF